MINIKINVHIICYNYLFFSSFVDTVYTRIFFAHISSLNEIKNNNMSDIELQNKSITTLID